MFCINNLHLCDKFLFSSSKRTTVRVLKMFSLYLQYMYVKNLLNISGIEQNLVTKERKMFIQRLLLILLSRNYSSHQRVKGHSRQKKRRALHRRKSQTQLDNPRSPSVYSSNWQPLGMFHRQIIYNNSQMYKGG